MIPYQATIESASKTFGIEPALIAGIIKVESNWNPGATRHEPSVNDTSYGLMQVLLGTARDVVGSSISSTELLQPETNIYIGTRYFYSQLQDYGTIDKAISAYNAGRPISENQAYVNSVKWWTSFYSYLIPYSNYLIIPLILSLGLIIATQKRSK